MAAASIMQNEEQLSVLEANASIYIKKVLMKPTQEDKSETHWDKMVNRLYQIIKNACPAQDEVIHFVIMERDLAEPSSSKNRLPTEFCKVLLSELRKKLIENNESWKVEFDRILASKHRTSRAKSYGIHRIAQQALMLYQSMYDEEITPNEKVIIVDDHIQAGSAVAISASEVLRRNANLLTVACISSHKNNLFFNIQPKVIKFITSLLPHGEKDLIILNEILQLVGLTIETLTNHEGLILSAIFCDPENEEHKAKFLHLLNTYDVSLDINNPLFINQENSLQTDFEKSKVEFSNFKSELLAAIEKGRYTIPYTKQMILTFKAGQDIRNEFIARADLPWLLFDFDGTLHNLHNNTFRIFQDIIKTYCGVEIPLEDIEQTRQSLKESKQDQYQYQYQEMLLSFIKQHNSAEKFTNELTGFEAKRINARKHWEFLRSKTIKQPEIKECASESSLDSCKSRLSYMSGKL